MADLSPQERAQRALLEHPESEQRRLEVLAARNPGTPIVRWVERYRQDRALLLRAAAGAELGSAN
jgi:hypothetical protein